MTAETEPTKRLASLLREIRHLLGTELGPESHLAFVYGSWAYNLQKPDSDVDLMIIGCTVEERRKEEIIASVVELFRQYAFNTDEEVPYETKLIVTWNDVENAIAGLGFARRGDRLVATPVEKTSSFLCSEEIRLRLILNALTGPSLLVAGRLERLSDLQKRARMNWLRILPLLLNFTDFSIQSFVSNLIGTDDCNGEWFLGFKEARPVRSFLENVFEVACRDAVACGLLKRSGDSYSVSNQEWLNELL